MHYQTFGGLIDSNGDIIKRPMSATKWYRPEIWGASNRFLAFGYSKEDAEAFDADPPPQPTIRGDARTFDEFLALDVYDPKAVARFASKWGILDIQRFSEQILKCEWDGSDKLGKRQRHWFARGSKPYRELTSSRHIDFLFGTDTVDEESQCTIGWEPMYVWRYWHKLITSALRIGSDLEGSLHSHWNDWCIVAGSAYEMSDAEQFRERLLEWPDYRCNIFDSIIESWMIIGGVELEFRSFPTPSLEIRTPSLFASLIVHLAAALAGSGGYVLCSSCKRIYAPKRKPKVDVTNNYCKRRACQRFANAERVRAKRDRDRKATTLVDSLATKEKKRVKSG